MSSHSALSQPACKYSCWSCFIVSNRSSFLSCAGNLQMTFFSFFLSFLFFFLYHDTKYYFFFLFLFSLYITIMLGLQYTSSFTSDVANSLLLMIVRFEICNAPGENCFATLPYIYIYISKVNWISRLYWLAIDSHLDNYSSCISR